MDLLSHQTSMLLIVQDVLTATIAAVCVLDAGSYSATAFATCGRITTASLQDPSPTI